MPQNHDKDAVTPSKWDTVEEFARLAAGDQLAAEGMFHRYLERLILAARRRMSAKLAARVDPEDVVMSAYRSFFMRARDGKFEIENSGELWRLLLEITTHKVYRQASFHRAQKRTFEAESTVDMPTVLDRQQASPDQAVIVADEVETLMSQLDETGRRVLQLRLQDYSMVEIAGQLGVNEKTVRRHMAKAKSKLLATMAVEKPEAKATSKNCVSRTESLSAYRLLAQIGSGTTGKVYRAIEKATGKEYAVKYLRKKFLRDRVLLSRFDEEIQTLERIDHRSIVRIHSHGMTPGGGRFYVMDLIRGGDLQGHISAKPCKVSDAVDWIGQAAEGIAAAHARGVVHCDLKPANLLLRENGELVVTDFGFARDLRNSVAPAFAGTPAFMAPEQIDPFYGPIGVTTDVYGLGLCLYVLLTGRAAFEGEDVSDVLGSIVSGVVAEPPENFRNDIPSELSDICLRAIAKKPRERFQSAAAFREALSAFSRSC